MVQQVSAFFAAHPKLYDVTLVAWVLVVTAASIYTILNWK